MADAPGASCSARPVAFADDCVGDRRSAAVDAGAPAGGVVLLENLRFHPEEEKNDPAFAAALAVARRSSTSTMRSARRIGRTRRSKASRITCRRPAAGLLMEQELQYLGHALESPERPFVAILGGAKVSDKIEVIENLLGKVDRLLIGGAMAYTFFKARGVPVGTSLVEDDKLDAARTIDADADGARRHARAADRSRRRPIASKRARRTKCSRSAIAAIGDRHRRRHRAGDHRGATRALIADAKTVVWNGPMGVFEIDAFAAGTNAVARAVADVQGHDDRRRRRFDRGGEEGRRRRPHHAHLDRRRRLARIPRRPHAARRRGADRQMSGAADLDASSCAPRSSPATGRCSRPSHEAVVVRQGAARASSRTSTDVEIVVAPPFTARARGGRGARATRNIGVAAQNLYWEREGAFTGEVSAAMVKEAGAEYAIVGHSERRRLFGETDAIVNRKTTRGARRPG